MKKIRTVVCGLGGRGISMIPLIEEIEETQVVAVCDKSEKSIENYRASVEKKECGDYPIFRSFEECLEKMKPDAVYIATSWENHLEECMTAMKKNVAVACEVGGGYSIESAWDLVKCYEKTKTPIMFMENCCYGETELLALNMKRKGVLGEIVHCEGGYRHDLRAEIIRGADGSHYRFMQYKSRNCENYPTHEIGPIAKLLDINCGNRFESIYSVASKSAGLKEYIKLIGKTDLNDIEFKQGDVITSVIKCANGETITITLDTTVPRYYSRGFLVEGTKGIISEDTDAVYLQEDVEKSHRRKDYLGSKEKYRERYGHPLWKSLVKTDVHGGIDHITVSEFFKALSSGKKMPIDVYDMATWITISALSEQSVATGQAVAFPDFTNGRWVTVENKFLSEYDD